MNRTVLYSLIGDLCNDPNHDRYSTSQIDNQLDIVQDRWNVDAGLLVDTVTITTVSGTRSYALSSLTGTPIDFRRVTHKGLELVKRSKTWFDLYASDDWSDDVGTPTQYYIEVTGTGYNIVLYPIPQDADAGANLVVEYVKRHTAISSASDEPFNSLSYLGPYHYGVAYRVASNLMAQDPDPMNAAKAARYLKISEESFSDLFQHFKEFEKDEPLRLSGGAILEILKRLALAALLIGSVSVANAEQIASDKFGYLNNNEAPAIIDQEEAQDLLNVDVTPGGKSIKKRPGYGLYKAVGGSSALHGGYHFFDSSGNDVQLWGSNTSLYGSVADTSFVQLVSSATTGATWDCTDTSGFAYCVDSSRDALIRTNGATISWYTSPLGTMATVTPERLVISGVAANANTLYFSEANNYTNFVTGIQVTSPWTEVIASPGSRITNIEYACGKLLWWKDQSFGYALGTDQTNLQVGIISPVIGTQDNSTAIDPNGNVYFRGQDGHIYVYNCSTVQKLSVAITPNIQTSGRRVSNSFAQTSQPDFQSGSIVPSDGLSTTISPGDLLPSSFTVTDTSTADFSSGTLSNLQISSIGNSLVLSTNTASGYGSPFTTNGGVWSVAGAFSNPYVNCGTMSDKGGDSTTIQHSETSDWTLTAQLIEQNGGTVIASVAIPYAAGACSWTQRTLTAGSAWARKRAYIKFSCSADSSHSLQTSNTFLLNGTSTTFWTASDLKGSSKIIFVDGAASFTVLDGGVSDIATGNFTSRAFDTGITNSYVSLSSSATIDDFTPAFTIQDATSTTGAWAQIATAANQSVPSRRYVRYISTFTVTGSSDAATSLNDVTFVARSSGTYYSPVQNKPNLRTWDTFNANVVASSGTQTFYMRSSTSAFTVLSSTPSWTAQTVGAVITISTGTYFQVRDDFALTASSYVPTLNDFTVNWFEGTASDKAYATYFDNAIWWTLAYGSGITTNNYIFKFDLLNPGWTLYDFGTGGFLVQNNNLYFGSTSGSSVFRYGSTTSDNGSAISAYWQSKDFTGGDPWLENEFLQIDTFARRNAGQTLSVGYALNSSTTTTSYSVSLSSSTDAAIRNKKLLPAGKNGGLISVKFSDSSTSSAWEILGYRITYRPLPYRPTQ